MATTFDLAELDLQDLRKTLTSFVSRGLASYGFGNSDKTLLDQAKVIRSISENSLSAAFGLWSHRMTSEYIARFAHNEKLHEWGNELLLGTRLGSTALATALVDASGRGLLPITFSQTSDGIVLNGRIPWASNLHTDTLIVFAARNEEGNRFVFTATLDTPGFSFQIEDQLLEMNNTNSGSVLIENAFIPESQILSESLSDFLAIMRPRFLTLQTSFCLGVSGASLSSLEHAKGALPFSEEIASLRAEFTGLENRLVELGGKLSNQGEVVVAKPYLELRLAAAILAQQVTRLELAAVGGQGYSNSSHTARRIHEALFFSVQAPTEGALRWELSQLN